MSEKEILAERFEASRGHLRAVAYRMLGSVSEADDAVQESWLRLARTDASAVENFRGWLTTTVARICLDMLRARKARREEPIGVDAEAIASGDDVEKEALIADSVGVAMLVVLETLAPAERVAFVLHDMFNLPFDEIAPIVGRTSAAARQLASRARRRVQGAPPSTELDQARQRKVVGAFLAAARDDDFSKLLALLDPDVVLRADAAAVAASLARAAAGAPALAPEIRGHQAVAKTFSGRAQAAQLAVVEGNVGLVFAPGGRPMAVFDFVIEDDRIVEINLLADRTAIAALELAF
ncbi:MAG: sigma-70 family RNA polymerase sigma factor [Reyranella sp.]|uniref:sigma-70 family RNA polymerase sigma factor n=1 Tax=Reyranella sp. TaxID=1929291 RepID=UPI003D0D7708